MTPLEKALQGEGKVNYCDECEQFQIVGNAAYCKVDGKLIHPIMLARGQGTGPAWNCKKRQKPVTNYDRFCSDMEYLAKYLADLSGGDCPPESPECEYCRLSGEPWKCWLDWLKQEASE